MSTVKDVETMKKYENVGKNYKDINLDGYKTIMNDYARLKERKLPYTIKGVTSVCKFNHRWPEVEVKNTRSEYVGTAALVTSSKESFLRLVVYNVDGRVYTKEEKEKMDTPNKCGFKPGFIERDTPICGVLYFDKYLQPINCNGEILRANPRKGELPTQWRSWNGNLLQGSAGVGMFLADWQRAIANNWDLYKRYVSNFLFPEACRLEKQRVARWGESYNKLYLSDYAILLKKERERNPSEKQDKTSLVTKLAEEPLTSDADIIAELYKDTRRLYGVKARDPETYESNLKYGYRRWDFTWKDDITYLDTIEVEGKNNKTKKYLVIRCFDVKINTGDPVNGRTSYSGYVDLPRDVDFPDIFKENGYTPKCRISGLSESRRFYVDSNKKIVQGEKDWRGVWAPPHSKASSYWNLGGDVWNIDVLKTSGVVQYTNYIDKFLNIFNETNERRHRGRYGSYDPNRAKTLCLYYLLQNVYLEQLVNAGYVYTALYACLDGSSPQIFMRDYLGIKSVKKTSPLMKEMKFPKVYLQTIEDKCKDKYTGEDSGYYNSVRLVYYSSIERMLERLNLDTSFIQDPDNLKMIWETTNNNPFQASWYRDDDTRIIGAPQPITMLRRLWKWKEEQKGIDPFQLYRDTLRSWRDLNADSVAKNAIAERNIKTLQDLQNTHDAAFTELNQQRAERDRRHMEELKTSFEKHNKKRMKYEEENDEYMIIVPKELNDIKLEGANLHHCVGGYVNHVANGETTILFLRRKSMPNISWFTIEVSNSGNIVQIHGNHNKWLSSDDDGYAAVPFVKKWIDKHELSCSRQILLSKAQGYSAHGAALREAPEGVKI